MSDIIELLNVKSRVQDILLSNTGKFSGVGVSQSEGMVNVYLREPSEYAKQKAYELLGGKKVDSTEIKFIPTGNIKALSCPISRKTYNRPVCGGMSCGHQKVTAGTLGGLVYDNSSKKPLGISNNHVLSAGSTYESPQAVVGDPIFSPGLYDTDGIQYPFGKLYKYVPMNTTTTNFVDCALVEPDVTSDLSSEIIGIGELQGWEYSKEGMRIIKSGRTSGTTEGTIIDRFATLEIDYGNTIIRMTDTIVTGKTAVGGDSGSLAVAKDTNKAVGLLFAGSDEITCYNRIENVMNALDILILPTDIMPPIPDMGVPSTYEYFVKSLVLTTIGIGAVVSFLPAIDQQIQLALHRNL